MTTTDHTAQRAAEAREYLRRSVGTMAGIAQARIRQQAQQIREAREMRKDEK